MKKEKSKLTLLKEVVQEITPQQQFMIKGGTIPSVPTGKRKPVKTI